MPRFELSVTGVTAATGAAIATINTTAGVPIRIREFGLFNTTGVATSFLLGKPANTPVASTTTASTLSLHAAGSAESTAAALVGTAWSTAPTAPTATNSGRAITLPANIGAGIIWTWYDNPLELLVSSWLVVWNWGAGTTAANRVYFVWDE